ncbi:hypothetical protein C8J57DRAFT_1222451 [Mycena rebaudengoi]|nr:hypothetical protein C8J57DRAFT_1222451 [Mycena rebaudengoi]
MHVVFTDFKSRASSLPLSSSRLVNPPNISKLGNARAKSYGRKAYALIQGESSIHMRTRDHTPARVACRSADDSAEPTQHERTGEMQSAVNAETAPIVPTVPAQQRRACTGRGALGVPDEYRTALWRTSRAQLDAACEICGNAVQAQTRTGAHKPGTCAARVAPLSLGKAADGSGAVQRACRMLRASAARSRPASRCPNGMQHQRARGSFSTAQIWRVKISVLSANIGGSVRTRNCL